jgi:hypothetical protein
VIIRVRPGTQGGVLECIRQHDHAAVSAALAGSWRLGGTPDDEVCFAVRHHDVAWVGLDHRALLGPDGMPYSFLDHPLAARYRALIVGVDLVEQGSAYAALLCSRHYARFSALLDDDRSRAHLAHERARQERLWPQLTAAQQARAGADLALVQLLDALALFVCCNEPGTVTWPFHRDGFRFGDTVLHARWDGPGRVRLDPDPLAGPVTCTYPAYRWDRDGVLVDRVDHVVTFGG